MTATVLGLIFTTLGALGWLFSSRLLLVTLAATAAFPTSAGLIVGDFGIPPFHVVGVFALLSALASWVRGTRVRHPAAVLLITFLGWSLIVTALAPAVFAGIPVLDPKLGIDRQVQDPSPLTYTPSIGAQVAYLVVGVAVAIYIAQRSSVAQWLPTVPFVLGSFFSAVAAIPGGKPLVDSLFRNSASAWYSQWELRNSGVFAEPSFLGVFSVTALSYTIYRFRAAGHGERVFLTATLLTAGANLLTSRSGVGALGFLILVAAGIAYYGWRFVFAGSRMRPAWLLVPFGLLLLIMLPNPLSDTLSAVIEGKSDTDSLRNRSGSDLFSIDLTGQTFGFGVGLGASRPSSFATLVLSNVGIIGFALLFAVVLVAMLRLRAHKEWVAVGVALGALIVTKVIAEPALSTPLLWFLLGVCMYAGKTKNPPTEGLRVGRPDGRGVQWSSQAPALTAR